MDKQMFSANRTRLRHLLFATLIGAMATLVRAVVHPLLGDALPFVFAFPATVLAALMWGALPGIVAAAVCAIGVWSPQIPPTIAGSQQASQFVTYAFAALLTAFLCGDLRGSRPFEPAANSPQSRESPLGVWLRAVLWGAIFLPLSAFVAASWWSLDRAEADSRKSLTHASDLALRQAARAFAVAQEIAARDPKFNIADRGYFQRLRSSPLPIAISEIMVGRQSGKEVMNVVIRRHTAEGSFKGIVTVTLTPSFSVTTINRSPMSSRRSRPSPWCAATGRSWHAGPTRRSATTLPRIAIS